MALPHLDCPRGGILETVFDSCWLLLHSMGDVLQGFLLLDISTIYQQP